MTASEQPQQPFNPDPAEIPARTGARRDLLILTGVVLLCLLPFIDKAYHIDDPLFIRTAQQITRDPLHFYGFTINWGGETLPMAEVTKNPPLASYFIALTAIAGGWSERAVHAGMLLPAILAAAGLYMLARRWTAHPLAASLTGILTPVFLLSASTAMCDVMMLAFYVWTIELWIRGLERNSHLLLFTASLLAAGCALTKYFGMTVIPLIAVYTVVERKTIVPSLLWLLAPVGLLAGYQAMTTAMYGRGLLTDAADYARAAGRGNLITGLTTGFIFTGGCLITIVVLVPMIVRSIMGAAGVILLLAVGAGLVVWTGIHGAAPMFVLQASAFCAAGLAVFLPALSVIRRRPPASTIILFLWLAGTFLFAALANWTCNGRSILPMVPPFAILTVRFFLPGSRDVRSRVPSRLIIPLILPAVLSLLIVYADYSHASSAKIAAQRFGERYLRGRGSWFEGHWGFQYYLEQQGASPVEATSTGFRTGDMIVVPANNTGRIRLPGSLTTSMGTIAIPVFSGIACMRPGTAGFYSDIWGPLPWAITGNDYSELYTVLRVDRSFQLTP